MNEKELITFEQAVKLKELGFNEKCYQFYDWVGTLRDNYVSLFGYTEIVTSTSLCKSYNSTHNENYDAPSLFQVKNWLETKGFVICVEPLARFTTKWMHTGWWNYSILIIKENNELIEQSINMGNFSSSNEALSAGINDSIKFLEKKLKNK